MIQADYIVIGGISERSKAVAAAAGERRGGLVFSEPVEPAFVRYCTAAELEQAQQAAEDEGHAILTVVNLNESVRVGQLIRGGFVALINSCRSDRSS